MRTLPERSARFISSATESPMMYGLNSIIIALVLLVTVALVLEMGYRAGRRKQSSSTETTKTHVNAIQASLLGVLALLIGFSFSLALQRFDSRNKAVVEEANAIGTAYSRAQLLQASTREATLELWQRYVHLRVEEAAVSLAREADRQKIEAETDRLVTSLWKAAAGTIHEDANVVPTGLYVQALNDAIDAYARNDAELSRHVPEVILLLLYATFLMTAGVVGYAAGIGSHRPLIVTYVLMTLLVTLAFIIVDLDRPRRGLIEVDRSSLTKVKDSIDAQQSTGAP